MRVHHYSAEVTDKIVVKKTYDFEESPVRIEFGSSYVVLTKRELEELRESVDEMLKALDAKDEL